VRLVRQNRLLGDAEIDQSRAIFRFHSRVRGSRTQQHVAGFDVAMYDAVRVAVAHAVQDAPKRRTNVARGQFTVFAHRVRVLPRGAEQQIALISRLFQKRGVDSHDGWVRRHARERRRLDFAHSVSIADGAPVDDPRERIRALQNRVAGAKTLCRYF